MIQITPISTGIPVKTATQILIRTFFETDALTAQIYYSISDENGEKITDGNIELTEQQFTDWGADNTFVENIVLDKLCLTRLI